MIPRLKPTDLSQNAIGYVSVNKLEYLPSSEVKYLPNRSSDPLEGKTAKIGASLAPSHTASNIVFTTPVRLNRN